MFFNVLLHEKKGIIKHFTNVIFKFSLPEFGGWSIEQLSHPGPYMHNSTVLIYELHVRFHTTITTARPYSKEL